MPIIINAIPILLYALVKIQIKNHKIGDTRIIKPIRYNPKYRNTFLLFLLTKQ